jgi:hypothetical protein
MSKKSLFQVRYSTLAFPLREANVPLAENVTCPVEKTRHTAPFVSAV